MTTPQELWMHLFDNPFFRLSLREVNAHRVARDLKPLTALEYDGPAEKARKP